MIAASETRESVFSTYAYLCRRGARRFTRRGVDRCDLEQTAAIGLIKACDRYDPALATPFEAYAWMMIVGELMHYVRDHEHVVRLPRTRRREDRDIGPVRFLPIAIDGLDAAERDRFDLAIALAEGPSLDDRVAIAGALDRLTTTQRTVVLGIYALGLSKVEIGQRIGRSARHVRRLELCALTRIRQAMS